MSADQPGITRALVCHPQSPASGIEGVEVELRAAPSGLKCAYRIRAAPGALKIPTPDHPLDPQRLWEHTCCELFVARESAPSYEEWNFSPTGQHAHFEFEGYRCRAEQPSRPSLEIAVTVTLEPDRLQLQVEVPIDDEPRLLSPTVVLEDREGSKSYWALRHASAQPDFHHRDGFELAYPRHFVASS